MLVTQVAKLHHLMLGLDYRRNTEKTRKARSHNQVILFLAQEIVSSAVTSKKAADSATITRAPLFHEILGDF